MVCASATECAPSEKAIAPASASSPISAISRPSRRLVSAAEGKTRTFASSRARRRMKSTTAGSSTGGLVSGRMTRLVTPPAAAAALALAIVSRCSAPGSPTKTRMSTRPGATTSPRQSTTRASCGSWSRVTAGPTPAMTPVHGEEPAARFGLALGIDEAGVEKGDRRARTCAAISQRRMRLQATCGAARAASPRGPSRTASAGPLQPAFG